MNGQNLLSTSHVAMPKYCCEGQGFGTAAGRNPLPAPMCSNSSVWTLKPGASDYSLCTKKCTNYHCVAKSCPGHDYCSFNRFHTCGQVPPQWIEEYCLALNLAQAPRSRWLIYAIMVILGSVALIASFLVKYKSST